MTINKQRVMKKTPAQVDSNFQLEGCSQPKQAVANVVLIGDDSGESW